jgi:hypothetical protein
MRDCVSLHWLWSLHFWSLVWRFVSKPVFVDFFNGSSEESHALLNRRIVLEKVWLLLVNFACFVVVEHLIDDVF